MITVSMSTDEAVVVKRALIHYLSDCESSEVDLVNGVIDGLSEKMDERDNVIPTFEVKVKISPDLLALTGRAREDALELVSSEIVPRVKRLMGRKD